MAYFDYTATTPVNEEVLNSYIKTTNSFFANTTSLHKLGQMSNYMLEVAIEDIKNTLDIPLHNVVFTSNATEANNLAIFGITDKYKSGKIITTKIEHPSVFNVYQYLEEKFEVVYLNITENGIIDIDQLKSEINNDTVLVSVMWVNNIIGTIQPIKKIMEILKPFPKSKLHVDMVQGLCKIIPDFKLCDIDLMTFSTHKIYGPKGIGGLFFKKNIILSKRLFGSSTQYEVKPGTLDLSLVVATAKTFKIFYHQIEQNHQRVIKFFSYLYDELKQINKIFINTPVINITHYILNISFQNIYGETIVHELEKNDIYISTGSACSSKNRIPEKTIFALTNSSDRALASVRISLSHLTTEEEIDDLIKALKEI